jgi:uncharacterized protein YbaR (Trm112 family)
VSFDKQLLDIICCPATHMPLRLMPETLLGRLNDRIASGELKYRDDSPVTEAMEQALMTEDERIAYPIRDDIPLLLEEFGIPITQADGP